MAMRRRRLLYLLVAAALIALWWWWQQQQQQHDRSGATPIADLSSSIPKKKIDISLRPEESSSAQHQLKAKPTKNSRLQYTVSSFIPLPTGKPLVIPKIQFPFPPSAPRVQEARLAAVKEAFLHSWTAYKKYAWMKDELAPLTAGYRTTFSGWAATLVDSLDTLWIMGLEREFNEAVNAAVMIDFSKLAHIPINVFETTIRYLGGFLGAYDVSEGKYPILLEKAREVGEMLYEAFDTPNRMPVTRWSKSGVEVAAGDALIAEIGSLSLEFTRLSQLTGDPKYFDAVQRITDHLSEQQNRTKIPGLFPITVNAREADFTSSSVFTVGGMADSLYEYFPKQYLMLGGLSKQYKAMYETALVAIQNHILFRPMTPTDESVIFAGTVRIFTAPKLELDPTMQHLACFAGGMIAAAAKIFNRPPTDIDLARQITNGCLWAGKVTASGIMPELFTSTPCKGPLWKEQCKWDEQVWMQDMFQRNTHDDQDSHEKQLPSQERLELKKKRLRLPPGISAIANRQYLLRPEVIESVFVMYRVMGEEKWRDEAWTLFTAITAATRTEIAFAALEDVTRDRDKNDNVSSSRGRNTDRMESFWLAETLKYFYLIFSDPDVVSLDEYVLNTEAHPFRRPKTS